MDSTNDDSLIGSVLDGRYRIISRLEQDDMTVVYKAEHQLMKRIVTVRIWTSDSDLSIDDLKLVNKDATAQGIHDSGVTPEGRHYVVSDYSAENPNGNFGPRVETADSKALRDRGGESESVQQMPRPASISAARKATIISLTLPAVTAGLFYWYFSSDSGSVSLAKLQLLGQSIGLSSRDPRLLGPMNHLVDAYVRSGRYGDAAVQCEIIVDITKKKSIGDSVELADAYDRLADMYSHLKGSEDKSRQYRLESTGILIRLAMADRNEQRYDQAALLFPKVLAHYEKLRGNRFYENMHGDRSNEIAGVLYYFACTQQSIGGLRKDQLAFSQAKDLFSKILRLNEAEPRQIAEPWVAMALTGLAATNRDMKNDAEAVNYYQRALAFCEKRLSPNDPMTMPLISDAESSARHYMQLQKYSLAETLTESVLSTKIKLLGDKNLAVAQTAVFLAILYRSQFQEPLDQPANKALSTKAALLCERALAIYEKSGSCKPLDLAFVVNLLATSDYARGRFVEALRDYQRTLSLYEKSTAPLKNERSAAITGSADTLLKLGRYPEAEIAYKNALEMYKKESSADKLNPAILQRLADCEFHDGKYADALAHCRQGIEVAPKSEIMLLQLLDVTEKRCVEKIH